MGRFGKGSPSPPREESGKGALPMPRKFFNFRAKMKRSGAFLALF